MDDPLPAEFSRYRKAQLADLYALYITQTLMLKTLLSFVQIIISIYWAGNIARQNQKIDELVTYLENGYDSFNKKLKDAKINESLLSLKKLYGWSAVLFFSMSFVLPRLIESNPSLFNVPLLVSFGSAFGWFSIKWCLHHRKTVQEIGPQILLMIFSPVLVGIFDLLFNISFMHIFATSLYSIPLPFDWEIPYFTNPIIIGLIFSILLASLFFFYYIITWIFTAPAAFVSVTIILLPVLFARFIHTIAPKKPFFGFTIILYAAAAFGSSWIE
ncbi:hypothetical protein ACFO0J_01285 [Castellaniella hirudinis]|uniref:Uncharacterized protein n=1 Tax=Castellaniella hirudinis TaxID=1144617 RepID=A0ABV8RWQ8_9BURK